jgi:hypothetical protein
MRALLCAIVAFGLFQPGALADKKKEKAVDKVEKDVDKGEKKPVAKDPKKTDPKKTSSPKPSSPKK